ncbi:hypothetical protein XELAEV_18035332mg [Xenopus laevis]|uniref:Paraneoplastic antigen Ma-like C-terminal domain-containing protein n=1 Tax=Xenopus laevis TaxID=8355 RepID=A0A974CFI9_XENLA|nr:hypothetical protein XELAEV_18035332mg [Xenopus laevis]
MVPRVKGEFIHEVLDGEQIFYRPRVSASCRDSARVLLNVLIDSPREIDHDRVTPDIDAESEGPWKIVLLDMSDEADELKVFSGTAPVPSGDKSFESLRDYTVVSVKGWTGPETTMRRKILESLRSPAVDVVKSYMVGHPDATSGDLIEVLEVTFGPVESVTEILYRLNSTFQKEKEDLSVYLVRLEQGLRLLVSHMAITDNEMDSLRICQLKRGTLNSDPVAVTIRAHYRDKLPPRHVALMEKIRREEVDAYVRVKQSSTSGHTEKFPADAKLLKENKKLCKELEERFYGRCYKCQVMGHQAQSYKTYKNSTVQKSYHEPSICESDSPEEDKPTYRMESDPISWPPQCILGREGMPVFGSNCTGSPRELNRPSTSSCKTVKYREAVTFVESVEVQIEPILFPAKLLETQKEKGATVEIDPVAELPVISSVIASESIPVSEPPKG